MSDQEFNEGHIPEAMDRLHIILGMIDDLLIDHPGIVKAEVSEKVQKASYILSAVYQKVGNYEVDKS